MEIIVCNFGIRQKIDLFRGIDFFDEVFKVRVKIKGSPIQRHTAM
ncbi:hypothetical protein CEXT_623121, partial [Caerostris extrusa]